MRVGYLCICHNAPQHTYNNSHRWLKNYRPELDANHRPRRLHRMIPDHWATEGTPHALPVNRYIRTVITQLKPLK